MFNAVFAVEPLFKQLVVSTCNVGIFSGRPSHPNVIKMIQLLCLARLQQRNLLPTQAVARQSYYHAMAIAEGLGPYVPGAWKMAQYNARRAIINAVEWLLSIDGRQELGFEPVEWFDSEILGIDHAVIEGGVIPNCETALVLLEAMAVILPSNAAWLNGLSFVSTALLSLGRRGTITDDLRDRVTQGVKEAMSATVVIISPATVKRFYTVYCTNINANNAAVLFAHYQHLIPENVIALRNVVLQAAGSGMTTSIVVKYFPCFILRNSHLRFPNL